MPAWILRKCGTIVIILLYYSRMHIKSQKRKKNSSQFIVYIQRILKMFFHGHRKWTSYFVYSLEFVFVWRKRVFGFYDSWKYRQLNEWRNWKDRFHSIDTNTGVEKLPSICFSVGKHLFFVFSDFSLCGAKVTQDCIVFFGRHTLQWMSLSLQGYATF